MRIFNNVSALDTIAGPYSACWSQAGWTNQQLVSTSVATATGGTYAIKFPEDEKTASKSEPTKAKKTVSKK